MTEGNQASTTRQAQLDKHNRTFARAIVQMRFYGFEIERNQIAGSRLA